MRVRGIHELYSEDPERADHALWGRRCDPRTRRGFLRDVGLATMAATLGSSVPFARFLPGGLIPAALADTTEPFVIEGKDGLVVLNDRPLNAETPPHLLDDEITPASRLFVRNGGLVPEIARRMDATGWSLTIDGEVERPLSLTLDDLRSDFESHSHPLVLECGGNGRAGFRPRVRAPQWTYGAVGCPRWTGVRLGDVLRRAGLRSGAVYTGFYGMDVHPSGDPDRVVISRGTPIASALADTTLIAWELNGEPLPALHGFPARLVCPGFPGSASGKWLERITVRDRVHDGAKMGGRYYRVPRHPVAPGTRVPEDDLEIIEKMPVKSLITFPRSGTHIGTRTLSCRGFAWTGDERVVAVDVSYDFGQTWVPTRLAEPVNRYAWQRWEVTLELPSPGYFEVWSRATDTTGRMQPMVVPGWNPSGYLNNAMPRIAVHVG